MNKADRHILAKMFLFIIRGISVIIALIYRSTESKAYMDKWMRETEEFAGQIDKWVEGQ